jgi:hypothetical protein
MIPIIPILAACTALLSAHIFDWTRRPRAINGRIVQGILALSLAGLMAWYVIVPARFMSPLVRDVRRYDVSCVFAAKIIRQDLPSGGTIGIYTAGVLPYLMPEYRFHDMLGKSDRSIAGSRAHWGPPGHNKWDYEYSLDQVKPAALVTAASYDGASDSQMRQQVKDQIDFGFNPALWLNPTFQKYYRPHRIVPGHRGKSPAIFEVYLRGGER